MFKARANSLPGNIWKMFRKGGVIISKEIIVFVQMGKLCVHQFVGWSCGSGWVVGW